MKGGGDSPFFYDHLFLAVINSNFCHPERRDEGPRAF